MHPICLPASVVMIATVSLNAPAQSHQPNVVFIYADDMGKGMLSAYGQQQFSTPNIDRLVAQGTSFDNAYGCMLSAPSRASLLTGYHDCHGDKWKISAGGRFLCSVQDTSVIALREQEINESDVTLEPDDVYLPQVFKRAGYITAAVGKLEWGFTATRRQMRLHGWDYYFGYLDHVRCHGYYPPFLFDDGTIVTIEGNTHENCGKSIENETPATLAERRDRTGKEVYSEDVFLDKTLQFIRKNRKRPFFLYYATQLPHGPVAVPAIHPEVAANTALTPIEKEYASMVKQLDATVGVIMGELEVQGLADNTVIVFSSDNGHEIYYSQKKRCEKPYRNLTTGELFDNLSNKYYSMLSGDVFNGNAGMAGLKRSNLEGGIHVPLVFYGKGIVQQGKTVEGVVSNYDFLPTMAAWLNVPLSQKKDGESFLPQLLDGKPQRVGRYLIFGSNEGPAIITAEGWKLRWYLKGNTFELFNLKTDAQERHDVKAENPKIVKKLQTILLKECGGDLRNGINRAG